MFRFGLFMFVIMLSFASGYPMNPRYSTPTFARAFLHHPEVYPTNTMREGHSCNDRDVTLP